MSSEGSGNTAIVAILVLVVIVIAAGLIYFFGFYNRDGSSTKIIEKPALKIETGAPRKG